MFNKFVEIAPYMCYISHANKNMYLCSVVTSQLYVEITHLFHDCEITIYAITWQNQSFVQHFCNNMIDLNELEFQVSNIKIQ